MPSSSKALSDLTGTRVVVTGATNGIGMATARALARAGAQVVLAVRDTDLGARRAREFGGECEVIRLDLADLASVRTFVEELDGPVDVLVNNAGMFPHQHRTTRDGFELGMGTNFLGPFALTNLLLPRIRRQIVSVGSEGHRRARIDPADLDLRRTRWSPPRAYTGSKLAVMLWGLELDRRLRDVGSPVTSMLTDPGWAASNISNKPGLGVLHRAAQGLAGVVGNDLDAGAAPTLHCLTEPIPPGSYVGVDGPWGLRGRPVLSGRSLTACDYELAGRLWTEAEARTGTRWPLG
ncbi:MULTISPECIES: SDR family NAD(P)-dependent oxidoreductase [unclassified Gordonia (in: high G+C Gram-positive bacteria)]|uniref:SDR family NAD(P)-dependent oxidoreductase n=1 Tax=unclassified Gordonia (in: high G+C Gram-positive bacteria) TaxID=2657482 RepID=UPI00193AA67B|nr:MULTISPECIES: SDR family NAD(P)-dependent oxidoreductase [unclassified Gordonia (in: high G+C Gram-positive bacteria)]MCT1354815.1 SDR family NAD(P)-dependent oxidoreductase [Gordonia sp. p3-SID1431]